MNVLVKNIVIDDVSCNEVYPLLNTLNKLVLDNVHHYITDWLNYDLPKLIRTLDTKTDACFLAIIRECGTYLLEIKDGEFVTDEAEHIYEYYTSQENDNKYYLVEVINDYGLLSVRDELKSANRYIIKEVIPR